MVGFSKRLAFLYFIFIIIPAGFFLKVLRQDTMGLKFRNNQKTYWIEK